MLLPPAKTICRDAVERMNSYRIWLPHQKGTETEMIGNLISLRYSFAFECHLNDYT